MALRKTTKPPVVKKPTSLSKSTSKMLTATKRQAKKIDIKLPKDIEDYYTVDYETASTVTYPIINKSESIKVLSEVDPKLVNRFIVTFPERFNIAQWSVASFCKPVITPDNKGFLSIKLYDLTTVSISKKLLKLKDESLFKLKLDIVDPMGVIVESWKFKDCKINMIYWSELNYGKDDLSTITLNIDYGKLKIKENKDVRK